MDYCLHDSPLGALLLAGDGAGLRQLAFVSSAVAPADHWRLQPQPFSGLRQQLDHYFAGQRHHFDWPLAPAGTVCQQQVWQALLAIPYGQTRSYCQQAAAIGRPRAVRAVGAANGANPIAILIPCHRVIGSNGKLTGYAGGLPLKAALLALERGN